MTDILVTLFEAVLDLDPADPAWPQRDRFILSKGHCAAALYAEDGTVDITGNAMAWVLLRLPADAPVPSSAESARDQRGSVVRSAI